MVYNLPKYGEHILPQAPKLPGMIRSCQCDEANLRKDDCHPPFTGIMRKLRAAIAAQVPVGFEDESGFHYGSEPCAEPDHRAGFQAEPPSVSWDNGVPANVSR